MRGAWGKPYGTVARVNIGQILVSVRTRDSHRATAIEAFRRSMYKYVVLLGYRDRAITDWEIGSPVARRSSSPKTGVSPPSAVRNTLRNVQPVS